MPRNKDELYRANILEHVKAPHHWGRLPKADATHLESNPTCGDELTIDLAVQGRPIAGTGLSGTGLIISNIGLSGAGCAISIAAASMLSDRVAGQPLAQVKKISKQTILDDLGIDPGPSRLKCALLCWHALQKTLAQLKKE
jgi:nitrogen fixation NifU-like protein